MKNGETAKNWYFRTTINNKRTLVNTGTANKQEAHIFMNRYLAGKNTKGIFVKASPDVLIKRKETIVDVLHHTGWLNAKTNPKYLKAHAEERNYGVVQATKIADALRHMFDDFPVPKNFIAFLRLHTSLDVVKISFYEDFINTPFIELNKSHATNFQIFLKAYGDWLKENNKKKNFQWFMCQPAMNTIALKSFYTYSHEIGLVPENIFAKTKIARADSKKKPSFTLTQIQTMFRDDLAEYISAKEWDGFSSSRQFQAYKFLAFTGMRSGEVRALKWRQISADMKVLLIDSAFKIDSTKKVGAIGKPKWDKIRTIVIPDIARDCLGKRGRDNEFVFCLPNKNAIGSSKFIHDFKRYLGWLDVEFQIIQKKRKGATPFTQGMNFTPHAFRGSLNSLLLSTNSLRESLIQSYFGWTRKALTAVQSKSYTEMNKVAMWRVANEIEILFTGQPLPWTMEEEKKEEDFLAGADLILARRDMNSVGFNKELNKDVPALGTYKGAKDYLNIDEE